MTTEQILMYIKDMMADLIYVNGIIATELVRITENTAATRHGEEFLEKSPCIPEHDLINQKICDIIKKYKPDSSEYEALVKHVLKHLEEEEENW